MSTATSALYEYGVATLLCRSAFEHCLQTFRKLYPRMSSTFQHAQPLQSKDYKTYQRTGKENIRDAIECTNASANLSVWERWLVAKLQLEKEKSKLKVKEPGSFSYIIISLE